MKKILNLALVPFLMLSFVAPASAQTVLTLDQCRAMALEHNKSLQMASLSKDKATYERKAAFANYLPKVDLIGTYQYTSEKISLLSAEQKAKLSNLGTNTVNAIKSGAGELQTQLPAQLNALAQSNPEMIPYIQQASAYYQQAQAILSNPIVQQYGQALGQKAEQTLNAAGQSIVDAFDTDTRHLGIISVMLTQPLYMGGKIRAYDKITHYSEELAGQKLRLEEQETILSVDKAYWQVVSLTNKRNLAQGYRDLLAKLDEDVLKMIQEGVATKANELAVSVKLNEAEMTLMRIDDGLILSRMLLAQLCGMELEAVPQLADENLEGINIQLQSLDGEVDAALANRPELHQLELASNMLREKTKIVRSEMLPTLALTGGYLTTYPSLSNGFETKFHGMWNVGVSLKVPVWHWGQGNNKVKAAKVDVAMNNLRHEEAKEKIQLQVKQTALAVNEANRKLELSTKNLEKAEENLRVARIGFTEGLVPTSDLLAAQTAWLGANSDKIDAQIDIRLTQAAYNKAIGR